MRNYLLQRLLQMLLIIFLVSIIAFGILHIIPGDPVLAILGDTVTEQQITDLRQELRLDRPIVEQYGLWLSDFARGDFGRSIILNEDVAGLVAQRLPVTIHLGLSAFFLAIILGLPLGILSAVYHHRAPDTIITAFVNLGIAVPIFWLAFIVIYVFALRLSWVPVQGYTSPFDDFALSFRQSLMPIILLALPPMAVLARQTRSSMLDVLGQSYIRTARSKGLPERRIVLMHGFNNAIIPVVTVIGLLARTLVSGSVLVETVFNIPGMGRLMVSAIFSRDFAIVQTIVIIVGLTVSLANLAVDLSYAYLNPRIRIGG